MKTLKITLIYTIKKIDVEFIEYKVSILYTSEKGNNEYINKYTLLCDCYTHLIDEVRDIVLRHLNKNVNDFSTIHFLPINH